MSDVKPRVKVPKTASAGEVVTIKSLISHKMESGFAKDKEGNVIPRKIINKFVCTFADKPVLDMDIHPSVSTNPYIEFDAKVDASGEFKFAWTDDDGTVYEDTQSIEVA